MSQINNEANQPVAKSFHEAFKYTAAEAIAHQARSFGPAFRNLEKTYQVLGVPETCQADAFA